MTEQEHYPSAVEANETASNQDAVWFSQHPAAEFYFRRMIPGELCADGTCRCGPKPERARIRVTLMAPGTRSRMRADLPE